MSDECEDFGTLIEAAAAEYNADIFFYSGPIDDDGFEQISREIAQRQRRDRAVLIMVTNGGLANAAYKIARLFQRSYQEFKLFCPSKCKSAGTLVALGANTIIMDVFSELGPLDVQLIKQNEIASRKSGLLAKSSFEALSDEAFNLYEKLMISVTLKSRGNVSFKLASELAANMASTMLAPVYAQMNPEIVGGENRDLQVAYEYGVRLVKSSNNADEDTVSKLVSGYPSHDFIIDSAEARNLFVNVDEPTLSLYRIVGILGDAAQDEAPRTIAVSLTGRTQDADPANEEEAPDSNDTSSTGASSGRDGDHDSENKVAKLVTRN